MIIILIYFNLKFHICFLSVHEIPEIVISFQKLEYNVVIEK
jgi:hypothetical protein